MTGKEKFFGGVVFILILLILLLIFKPFGFVPVGHRGVAIKLGALTGKIRDEGIYFKVPIIEDNKNIEVRVQKKQVKASAASKDLQSVSSVIAVNFSIDPARVVDIYQQVGDDFDDRIVAPAIQESVKGVTARFTAEELITKRGEVSDAIMVELKERVGGYGIMIADLNIVDFDFSESFNASIERKVTAQQDALAAENKLKQIEFEAQQGIIASKGKAEAMRLESEALRQSPELLELKAIERWDGRLPLYTAGNNVPFINIE